MVGPPDAVYAGQMIVHLAELFRHISFSFILGRDNRSHVPYNNAAALLGALATGGKPVSVWMDVDRKNRVPIVANPGWFKKFHLINLEGAADQS